MKKLLFTLLCVFTLLVGCVSVEDDGGPFQLDYFIMSYDVPTSMETFETDGNSVSFIIESETIYGGLEFVELSERYGDTTYDALGTPYTYGAMAGDLEYINVTCRSDFDENHSAGELLNDIITTWFWYYYPYVSSGYKNSTKTSTFNSYLNEIDPDVHKLVSDNNLHPYIVFTSMPTDLDAEYTFDIEIKYDDYIVSTSFTKSDFAQL